MFRTTLRAIIRRRAVAAPAADWRSTNRSIARRRTPSASLAPRGAPTTPPEPVHGATAPAPDAAQPEPPVRSAKRASRRGGRPSARQQRPRTGVRAPWARPWAPSRTGRHHIRHTCPIHPARPTASAGGSAAGRSGGSKRWLAHIFHPSPSTPPVPKWRNDAIPRERRSRRAPESYAPATFSRPVDAPDRGGGGRRPGAPGAGAQHRRGRNLHRGRAARRGGEDGSRGARPGRDMALWEDRSGQHTGCARRFPHDSAVAAPMRRCAGRNDPPRAPESGFDGGRRAPQRARER